jgi:hypothetical protein
MATPTTVLQFTTLQNNNLKAALQTAQTNMTGKQSAYTAAAAALANLQTQLANTVADMTSVRNQLAGAVTPEDGKALLLQLQNDITTSRQTTGAIAIAQYNAGVAKAEADVAASEVQRLTAALTASTAALNDATVQDKRRSALKAALASPPLSTIVADAAAAAAGATFTAAQARLQGDLPAPLIAEAKERLLDEITRATASSQEYEQAQTLVEAKWTSDGGVTGAVLTLQNAFNRADAAFTAYVTTANDQFQQAKASLAKVADPTVAPLTPAEKASIHDPTTVTNAETAAAAEKKVDDAVAALAQKQEALDQAIRQAIAADVDSDPATNATVIAATTDRDNAEAALTSAKNAYTAALQQQTTAWEVLVPDSTWQLLAAFEKATATLNWLQNPGPAALSASMDTAEHALVTALLAADKSARTVAALKAEAAKRAAVANYESTAAESRRFSAVRGDF